MTPAILKSRCRLVLVILTILSSGDLVLADTKHGPYSLSRLKSILDKRGITSEAVYTGELAVNTRGGLKRASAFLSNIDIALTIDTSQAGLWENGTFFIYMLSNHNTRPLSSELVGDLQAVSNIEAPRTTRLYELWYEHKPGAGSFSFLFGLHDFNSEFAVTEYGGLYINSSFGIQPDISSGARPSIFPLAGPAARFKLDLEETLSLLLGIYDGNPGDPETSEHLPRSILASDQGAMIVAEVQKSAVWGKSRLPGVYKLGVWHNTGDFEDIVDTGPGSEAITRKGNTGGYFIFDQMLIREKDEQGLGMFLQVGAAPDYINEIDFYIGGGLNYRGLIPGRDRDEAGIAVAHASISDDLVEGGGRDRFETAIELTYKAQITENISVQPDIQFILNPGATEGLRNAVVPMLRFEIAL